MQAGPFGVVGICAARFEIAPIVVQRTINRNQCTSGASITTCQSLRCVLRLVKSQHVILVAVLEVVGERKAFGPVGALTGTGLEDPRAIGLVAAVHEGNAASERRPRVRPPANFEPQASAPAFQGAEADFACHCRSPALAMCRDGVCERLRRRMASYGNNFRPLNRL